MSENPVEFIVSHYGITLTAKFKDAPSPPDYVASIIIPAMFIIAPAIVAWLYKRRPKNYLKRYIKAIEAEADTPAQHKDESNQRLSQIRKEMTDQFTRGRITEEQYEMLSNKISSYIGNKDNKHE